MEVDDDGSVRCLESRGGRRERSASCSNKLEDRKCLRAELVLEDTRWGEGLNVER